jgi:hypothetical protein
LPGFTLPVVPGDREWFADFHKRAASLISDNNIKPNPITEQGTLDDITKGFELQKVSACIRVCLPGSFQLTRITVSSIVRQGLRFQARLQDCAVVMIRISCHCITSGRNEFIGIISRFAVSRVRTRIHSKSHYSGLVVIGTTCMFENQMRASCLRRQFWVTAGLSTGYTMIQSKVAWCSPCCRRWIPLVCQEPRGTR